MLASIVYPRPRNLLIVRALAGAEALRAPAETCVWDVRVMQRLIEIAEIV